MRRWRRRCRTRGTCTATTCGAPAAIDEAIAEFPAADALDGRYFAAEKIPVEYDWHYQHNLDLLATSYQYVGQMTKAEQRFRASFAIPSSLVAQEFNKREWPVFLLARGRAAEALEAASVMAGTDRRSSAPRVTWKRAARGWRSGSSRRPPTKATPPCG